MDPTDPVSDPDSDPDSDPQHCFKQFTWQESRFANNSMFVFLNTEHLIDTAC
jgi:hypothetical protein